MPITLDDIKALQESDSETQPSKKKGITLEDIKALQDSDSEQSYSMPPQTWGEWGKNAAINFGRGTEGVLTSALQGVAEGTRDMLNVPSGLANMASRMVSGKNIAPTIGELGDLSQLLGTPNYPIVRDLASIAPSLLAPEVAPIELSALNKSIGGNALYGASQNKDNPLVGGEIGAGIGATGAALSKLFDMVKKPVLRYMAGNTVNPILEKAKDILGLENPPEALPQALSGAYRDASAKAEQWKGKLIPMAEQADLKMPYFDSDHFVDKAKGMLEELKQKTKNERNIGKYKDSIQALSNYIEKPPKGYSDALNLNEEINDLPRTWKDANDASLNVLQGVSSRLGKALKEQVEMNGNSAKDSIGKDVSDLWAQQRKNYSKLKSFEQTPTGKNADGSLNLTWNAPQAQKVGAADNPDVKNFFLPTAKQDSTLKMEHFANLIGDEARAKQILKHAYFGDAMEKGELKPDTLRTLYQKLSPEQRNYLLTPEEDQYLGSAVKANNIYKKGKMPMSTIAGGLAGGLVGLGAGGAHGAFSDDGSPWRDSALAGLAGLAGGALGIHAIQRLYESPEGIKKLSNYINKNTDPRLGYIGAVPLYSVAKRFQKADENEK